MNLAPYADKTPLEIFRLIAFELKAFPDDVVQSQIDLAGILFCADKYGDAKNVVLALMAAHLMVIPGGIAASQGTGSGGPKGVKSIKEADLTITYADETTNSSSSASFSAWLSGSRFGELLLMIRRTMGFGLGFTAAGPGLFCNG